MGSNKNDTNKLISAREEQHLRPANLAKVCDKKHHLITVLKGSLKIQIASNIWSLSPNRSILIRSNTTYEPFAAARTNFCLISINPSDLILNDIFKLIDVSPLFKELILQSTRQKKLDRNTYKDQHIFALIKDHLETEYAEAIKVPIPEDERALKIYHLMVSKKQFDQPFEGLVKQVGASKRTLERIFQNEVGMTFSKWRQLLRLKESIELLSQGISVAEVSEAVGYSSSSAFTHAFKSYFGQPPGQYHKS